MAPINIAVCSIILIILLFALLYARSKKARKGVVLRTNVLYLMTVAYIIVMVIFVAIMDKLGAKEAWNVLEGPLMALIGGTLAISKDLIEDDGDEEGDEEETPPSPQEENNNPVTQPA